MKKKISFVVLLASLAVVTTWTTGLLSSCSSDIPDEKVSTDGSDATEDFQNLLSELDAYSADFHQAHPSNPASRGSFGRFFKSVKADVFGYSDFKDTYQTGVSISTSRKKWKEEKLAKDLEEVNEALDLSEKEEQEIEEEIESLKDRYMNNPSDIGALHNAVILCTYLEESKTKIVMNTTQEIAEETIEIMESFGIDVSEIDSQVLAEKTDYFFENIYDEDVEVMSERLIKLYPDKKDQIILLNKYMLNAEEFTDISDLEQFTKGYMDIVDKGYTGPQKIKTDLDKNISIAPSSLKLWKNISNIELK